MSQLSEAVRAPLNVSWVSVGVADMAAVRSLWVEQLGLDVIATRVGPDPELARLWNIPATQIAEQLVLATPGAATGRLHFVQFHDPAPAIRAAAASTDLGAKNLDVNCTGMPELVQQLQACGYTFRSAIGEYEIDNIKAREVQLPVHDAINLVLIEVLSAGFEVEFTRQGYAALTSFVVIVPDAEREVQFYQRLFGMQSILTHKLSGAAIEMAAGLPAGTVLDLRLLGEPDNLFGRMELIEYVGVQGANCFAAALPPATGILRCGFKVADAREFVAAAEAQNVELLVQTTVDAIFGTGRLLQLVSPAGLRIDVLAP